MADSQILDLTAAKRELDFVDQLGSDSQSLFRCIQCGTCTGSCPAANDMDMTPRRMWRMVRLGLVEDVLQSKTMWLCSMCYQCQVRCPRGIPLTEMITRLKQIAMERGYVRWRESRMFYRAFNDVVRRYGRMRELEFMARYLLSSDPIGAIRYAKLGLTLLRRGKIHPEIPAVNGAGRLDRLYARVAELEEEP